MVPEKIQADTAIAISAIKASCRASRCVMTIVAGPRSTRIAMQWNTTPR